MPGLANFALYGHAPMRQLTCRTCDRPVTWSWGVVTHDRTSPVGRPYTIDSVEGGWTHLTYARGRDAINRIDAHDPVVWPGNVPQPTEIYDRNAGEWVPLGRAA